jgi:hypothetical protein
LLLASGDKTALSIVIAGNASHKTKAVATELASCLQRISGAPFEVQIGRRWFFEAPEWEVVPSMPTLRVNLNRDEQSAILQPS